MPKKNKLILEKILDQELQQDDENGEYAGTDAGYDSDDSDAQLERDFAEGRLKPGLYGMVPFKRTAPMINDKDGLSKKMEEIAQYRDQWLERLDVMNDPAPITPDLIQQYGDLDLKINRRGEISGEELENNEQAQNDFKRELLFYRQAQSAVAECLKRFHHTYGIQNTRRPDDYFAEMLKSDEHMKKVHDKLHEKQTSIEASEKARRQRELKKYGKKVQQEVQLKRQQEKKELLEKIQKYKKGKLDSLDFLDNDGGDGGPKNKKKTAAKNQTTANGGRGKMKTTKKQRYKEARYGYGGKKKGSKMNSAESAADFSGFSAKKHGRPRMGKKKNNRPGKARRQKMRNSRK